MPIVVDKKPQGSPHSDHTYTMYLKELPAQIELRVSSKRIWQKSDEEIAESFDTIWQINENIDIIMERIE